MLDRHAFYMEGCSSQPSSTDHTAGTQENSSERGSTNFQRASMTLDAGVKIYAVRVDSFHKSAFQALQGMSRSGVPATTTGDPRHQATAGVYACTDGAGMCHAPPCSALPPAHAAICTKKFNTGCRVTIKQKGCSAKAPREFHDSPSKSPCT